MKRFQELLSVAEAREEKSKEIEEELPPGKLREFIERCWKFKEEVGVTSTRGNGLYIMTKANYILCDYCSEFHKRDEPCPFEEVAKKRKLKVNDSLS